MGTKYDGLIVDVSDATINDRLEIYRQTAGEGGKAITRREAASRLLAEALNRHFDEDASEPTETCSTCPGQANRLEGHGVTMNWSS